MAGSVNKVILVGNLGKDPETRTSQNGMKIVSLSVATSETWNDKKSGERQERTEWHRVVVFNERLADVAEKFLKKGRKVYLEGTLQTRKWTDQSGQDRYTTEVVLDRFRGELVLLDGRPDSDGDNGQNGTPRQQQNFSGPGARQGGGIQSAGNWGAPDGDVDDIPFSPCVD